MRVQAQQSSQPASDRTLKQFRTGAHRTIAPAETVARAKTIFGPLGITRVANVTGLDTIGIPVVTVVRPNARSIAVSQGKGRDLDSARASGIMESIELYHAERALTALKLASYDELRFSHDLISVDGLPRTVASRFSSDTSLLWTPGVDLFDGKAKWIPFELVHMNYTLPFPSGSGNFVMSSNGLASGNHPLEAVIHGLCELIERDATTLFRFRSVESQDTRRLDLDSVDDAICCELRRCFERANVLVGVWDVTSDIGVPTFQCIIVDGDANSFRPLGPVEGMGTHPVAAIALSRAMTEAAQSRLTLISGSRDDNDLERYRRTQDGALVERARARLSSRGTFCFGDCANREHASLEEDLAWILERLQAVGLTSAVCVDLTKPEFGIPVVRVVVPGLETYHHVEGYSPGSRALRALETLRGGLL